MGTPKEVPLTLGNAHLIQRNVVACRNISDLVLDGLCGYDLVSLKYIDLGMIWELYGLFSNLWATFGDILHLGT